MKRTFADLHLRLNPKDITEAINLTKKAAELGYGLISMPFNPETPMESNETLQKIRDAAGIDVASRVDLRPRTQNELTRQLRRLRRKFEVVCVICENKEVARQAAKDRRVDLLNFPSLDFHRRFFDRAEAELASHGMAALEVDVKALLVLEGPARTRLLSSLRREVAIAEDFHVPLVISSGVSAGLLLRKPREMAALALLFGVDDGVELDAVSANPVGIVMRNRGKLGAGFVAPGIRVVKGGQDC